jgi:putative DNA primase/helicase
VVQSNEIPKLPNRGQGLASKMLVLPFTKSFLGKEDLTLGQRLAAELPGIAVWAMKGAQRLIGEQDSGARWPVPRAAEDAVERFSVLNAPMQEFLDANFEQKDGGFVATSVLWARWLDWKKTSGTKDEMTQAKLLHRIVEESSWGLTRGRLGGERLRGLRGLAMKSE